jgi:hypothetical protein
MYDIIDVVSLGGLNKIIRLFNPITPKREATLDITKAGTSRILRA